MAMLSLLTFVYCAALDNGVAPTDVILIVGGITISVVLAIQIPLWICCARTKICITHYLNSNFKSASVQFEIKHLLITTTLTAIVVGVAQLPLSNSKILSYSIKICFLLSRL